MRVTHGLCSAMIPRIAFTTENSVFNTDGIIFHVPETRFAGEATDKFCFQNVFLADCPSTKLANCPRFLFTLDAFHARDAVSPGCSGQLLLQLIGTSYFVRTLGSTRIQCASGCMGEKCEQEPSI